MERKRIRRENFTLLIMLFFFIIGAIGHLIPYTRPYFLNLTFWSLLFSGLIIIYLSILDSNYSFKLWIPLVYVLSTIIEIIGVKSGIIFGEYRYGETLGYKIMGTPIIIGLNWTIVILGTIKITEKFFYKNYLIKSVAAASLTVLFDMVLEPVAIELNYWSWKSVEPPTQNYIAWFIIAFIFSYIFFFSKAKTVSNSSAYYFLMQILFFTIVLYFKI